jgi:hypothetical protein
MLDAGSALTTAERFVLLDLAERARDKRGRLHGICWPSLKKIGERTGLNKRTVQRALDILAVATVVKVTPNAYGRQKQGNVYTLNIDRLEGMASAASIGDTESSVDCMIDMEKVSGDSVSCVQVTLTTSTGDTDDSLYRKNQEENQELEPACADAPVRALDFGEDCAQIPPPKPAPVKRRPLTDQDVESIRLAYPLKKAPVPARKAIRAQHALLMRGGVTTAAGVILPRMTSEEATAYLLERTRLYADSPKGRSKQFIPYPGTWFNAGAYTEDKSMWDEGAALPIRQVPPTKFSDPEAMNAR